MKMTPVAVAILTLPFTAVLASAQTDPMVMIHQAAANQLGLLEYCKAQGAVDDAPLAAQRSLMAQLPAPATPVATGDAETLGKQGTLSVNGTTMTLASAAQAHSTTVDAMCKQIGSTVVQGAAAMQQQQNAGGAPSMTGSMRGGMPGSAPAR